MTFQDRQTKVVQDFTKKLTEKMGFEQKALFHLAYAHLRAAMIGCVTMLGATNADPLDVYKAVRCAAAAILKGAEAAEEDPAFDRYLEAIRAAGKSGDGKEGQ